MIRVNGVVVEPFKFPAGEMKLEVKPIGMSTIEWHFESCEELVTIQLLAKHITKNHNKVFLIMPYIPFARMDRVKSEEEVFTLKHFCEIINSLNFTCVYVAEPHSDVSLALLDRVEIIYSVKDSVEKILKEINFKDDKDILFFPDAGAQKRYGDLQHPQLVGHKHRDWKTGNITHLEVCGTPPKEGFKALIVDDLCSYGGTFLHSAKKLRELGASEVYLLVGHCEDSVLKGELIQTDLIDRIYTTNSIFKEENQKITIVKEF